MAMKPQMLPAEISKMEEILFTYAPHVDVLEWGSGGSTVYFPEFLRRCGISYSWVSVEYNKGWYEKIAEVTQGDPDISVVLFDVGNNDLRQRHVPMNEYVAYPGTLGKKFDVIFVDGRKRRRCLIEAAKLLKSGGRVILHDARRTYYHCAFSKYPDSRMLLWSGLWQGRLEDPGWLKKTFNTFIYWSFRVHTFSFRFLPRRT